MEVHINYLAVVAAALASYVIAALWYGVIFKTTWIYERGCAAGLQTWWRPVPPGERQPGDCGRRSREGDGGRK